MRISDWSSDVCSSDLLCLAQRGRKSLTSPGLKTMTYRQPAEWAQHDWAWIGFPSNPAEWPNAFEGARMQAAAFANAVHATGQGEEVRQIGRASCRARVCPYVELPGVAVSLKKKIELKQNNSRKLTT